MVDKSLQKQKWLKADRVKALGLCIDDLPSMRAAEARPHGGISSFPMITVYCVVLETYRDKAGRFFEVAYPSMAHYNYSKQWTTEE